ncbi:MAG: hypothetical protein ACRC28_08935 [Clostridium sp.]|uniref:hypothetical protein n=1 Tax=Clostridium sp. TaxID=1506 RepID=UPI003F2CE1F1
MRNLNIKKGFITLGMGMILVLLLGIAISSVLSVNIKDVLFIEGIIAMIIGLVSLMGSGTSDLWTSIDHNGTRSANEEVLIMEKDRKYLLSKEIDVNLIAVMVLGFLTITLI